MCRNPRSRANGKRNETIFQELSFFSKRRNEVCSDKGRRECLFRDRSKFRRIPFLQFCNKFRRSTIVLFSCDATKIETVDESIRIFHARGRNLCSPTTTVPFSSLFRSSTLRRFNYSLFLFSCLFTTSELMGS